MDAQEHRPLAAFEIEEAQRIIGKKMWEGSTDSGPKVRQFFNGQEASLVARYLHERKFIDSTTYGNIMDDVADGREDIMIVVDSSQFIEGVNFQGDREFPPVDGHVAQLKDNNPEVHPSDRYDEKDPRDWWAR